MTSERSGLSVLRRPDRPRAELTSASQNGREFVAEPDRIAGYDDPPNGRPLPSLLPGLLPLGAFLPAGDLVVVDVETTGWLADAASITEIGAVRLSPGVARA